MTTLYSPIQTELSFGRAGDKGLRGLGLRVKSVVCVTSKVFHDDRSKRDGSGEMCGQGCQNISSSPGGAASGPERGEDGRQPRGEQEEPDLRQDQHRDARSDTGLPARHPGE